MDWECLAAANLGKICQFAAIPWDPHEDRPPNGQIRGRSQVTGGIRRAARRIVAGTRRLGQAGRGRFGPLAGRASGPDGSRIGKKSEIRAGNKSEIQNPKSETNSKSKEENQNRGGYAVEIPAFSPFFPFEFLDLFRISDFGFAFRIFSFPLGPLVALRSPRIMDFVTGKTLPLTGGNARFQRLFWGEMSTL